MQSALFCQFAKLQFGSPGIGCLTIPAHVANRLARAAMGRWPETGPFPKEKHRDTLRRLLTQWATITCVAALFFPLAPLGVAPTGTRPPIVVAILFPAIVFGVLTIVRYVREKELKATTDQDLRAAQESLREAARLSGGIFRWDGGRGEAEGVYLDQSYR